MLFIIRGFNVRCNITKKKNARRKAFAHGEEGVLFVRSRAVLARASQPVRAWELLPQPHAAVAAWSRHERRREEEVVEGGRVLVGRRRNCSEGSALSEREASRRSRGHGGRWT